MPLKDLLRRATYVLEKDLLRRTIYVPEKTSVNHTILLKKLLENDMVFETI